MFNINYILVSMKMPTSLIYIVFIALFASSCSSDFYMPRQSNLLILENKNDLKASLSYNHAQVAYGLTNTIGLKADYSFLRQEQARNDRRQLMGNAGIGFSTNKVIPALITKVPKLNSHPKLCLIGAEIYGNYGIGRISTTSKPEFFGGGFSPSQGSKTFEANLLNPNISAQVYWQTRSLTLNFGMRYGWLYYFDASGFGDFTVRELELASSIVEDSPVTVLNYDLQVSKGNDIVETFAQVTWSGSANPLIDQRASFSFGLKMNIPKLLNSIKRIK